MAEFEVLFKFGGSNRPLVVSRSTLSLQIDEHLAKLGFDTKKLATGDYILQKFSKKWDHFIDTTLSEVSANDILTITAVEQEVKTKTEKTRVSSCWLTNY